MLEISRIGCVVYLCILSVIDIWTRRIPLWFLAAAPAPPAARTTEESFWSKYLSLTRCGRGWGRGCPYLPDGDS